MALCRSLGISRSHFLGGPAVWTQDDRDLAEAYEQATNERCSSCNTTEADWRDPVTKKGLQEPRLMAVAMGCPGCAEASRVLDKVPDDRRAGAYVAFLPFDPDYFMQQ